jgi:alpha-tubulin suppressor-like RCC1 family protein
VGVPTTDDWEPSPLVVTDLDNAVHLSAGSGHTCALLDDATAACWGANEDGAVGDGTTVQRNQPTAVVGLSGVVQLEAGGGDACARLADGSGRCWGYGLWGQLGDGTYNIRLAPSAVIAGPVT